MKLNTNYVRGTTVSNPAWQLKWRHERDRAINLSRHNSNQTYGESRSQLNCVQNPVANQLGWAVTRLTWIREVRASKAGWDIGCPSVPTLFHLCQSYITKWVMLASTIFFCCHSNSTEKNPSSEANSRWACQKIPHILWNPKITYRVHKILPLVPILSQMNPVHTSPSYIL
jgi:hypothetical protein